MKKLLSLTLTAIMLISTIAVMTPYSALATDGEVEIASVSYKIGDEEIYAIAEGSITSTVTINSKASKDLKLITAAYTANADGSYELSGIAIDDAQANGETAQTLESQTVTGATTDGIVKVMLWDGSNKPVSTPDVLNNVSRDTRIKDVYITNNGKEYQLLFNEMNDENLASLYMDGTLDNNTSVPATVTSMSGVTRNVNLDLSGATVAIPSKSESGLEKEYTYNFYKNAETLNVAWEESFEGSTVSAEGIPSNGTWTGTTPTWTKYNKTNTGAVFAVDSEGDRNSVLKITREGYDPFSVNINNVYTTGVFSKSVVSVDVKAAGETKFCINGCGFLIGGKGGLSLQSDENTGTTKTFSPAFGGCAFELNKWHNVTCVVWKTKSNVADATVLLYVDGKCVLDSTTAYAPKSSDQEGSRPGSRNRVIKMEMVLSANGKTNMIDNIKVLGRSEW